MRGARLAIAAAASTAALACFASAAGAGETARRFRTVEDLEAAMEGDVAVLVTTALAKFVPAVAGLVVLVLWLNRAHDVRRGYRPPPPPRPPPTTPYGVWTSLGFALVAALGGGVLLGFLVGLTRTPIADLPLWGGLAAQAAGMIPVAILVGLARRAARRSPATAGRELPEILESPAASAPVPPPPSAPPLPLRTRLLAGTNVFLVFSLAAAAILLVGTLLLRYVGEKPVLQELVQEILEPTRPENPWLITGYAVLVAPFTEEVVFRGLLYPSLRRAWGPAAAALASSLLFALVHVSSETSFLSQVPTLASLFVLAVLLCRLMERTDSIAAATTAHALNNATSLLPVLVLRMAA